MTVRITNHRDGSVTIYVGEHSFYLEADESQEVHKATSQSLYGRKECRCDCYEVGVADGQQLEEG